MGRTIVTLPFSIEAVDRYLDLNGMRSVLIVDENERVKWANASFCQIFNQALCEIRGKALADFIHNGTLKDLIHHYAHSINQPAVSLMINDMIMQSRYSLMHLSCEKEEGGPCYLLFFEDIKNHTSLSLLQQFSGTFLKDVNLGVILVNMDFMLTDISQMACHILGVERDDVINKPMEEVFANVPIEHQLVQRSILDGQIIRNHAFSWTNNQERYELLMDSNLLKDEAGRTVGAYVIFKDVSNLRSLEEQVQRSDRLAMIGQISAGTAHEIRNPLTSIKGFLQVLKQSLKEHTLDKEYHYVEIMLKEIDRINDLVSEFLLLSKPKNVTFSSVNISSVLHDILPIIHNEAILHNVTVEYEPAPQLPPVIADRELLKQVCLNLSKNGIEAMVDGGTLRLVERVDPEERQVLVEVHDSGPGIPSFLIDKIFDPFFTTKEGGTGLGLSVCQRIIHDMSGTIRVSSKGFGTIFTVSIPYSD